MLRATAAETGCNSPTLFLLPEAMAGLFCLPALQLGVASDRVLAHIMYEEMIKPTFRPTKTPTLCLPFLSFSPYMLAQWRRFKIPAGQWNDTMDHHPGKNVDTGL